MIKEEVLGCVYSKVRNYAVHQNKKVNFRVSANAFRNEDLQGTLKELQCSRDLNDVSKTGSEVYGEKYGSVLPNLVARNVNEFEIWPLVASNKWDCSTSLRITPGVLLNSIVQAYSDLESEGLVLRYTTDLFEYVQSNKIKSCLKSPNQPSTDKESSGFSSSLKETHTGISTQACRQELLKFTFTYYGTSVPQLQKILYQSGLTDVCEVEILQQNPHYLRHTLTLPRNWPKLEDLCSALSCDSVQIEYTEECTMSAELDSKEKSQMVFDSPDLAFSSRSKKYRGVYLMNPLHRKIIVDNLHDRRMEIKNKELLRAQYTKELKKSKGAYEKWWLTQGKNPLCGSRIKYTSSNYSFFGQSWILASDNTTVDNRAPPPVKNNVTLEKGVAYAAPVCVPEGAEPPPIYIVNLSTVDTWKCDCAVCNGTLFSYIPSANIKLRGRGRVGRIRHLKTPVATIQESVKETETPPSLPKTPSPKKKRTHVVLNAKPPRSQIGSARPKNLRHGKKKRKDEEKKKIDPDLWYETLSTYTTPKWRDSPLEKETLPPLKYTKAKENTLCVNKLKINYSIEVLQNKKAEKQNAKKKEASDMKKQMNKTIITKERKSLGITPSIEELNMDVLRGHGIIYERKQGIGIPYTKLDINTENMLGQGDQAESKRAVKLPSIVEDATVVLESDIKCVEYIKNEQQKTENIVQHENYFTKNVPSNFELLCLTGLAEYTVRLESVMTSRDFAHNDSITINRKPICGYINGGNDLEQNKL